MDAPGRKKATEASGHLTPGEIFNVNISFFHIESLLLLYIAQSMKSVRPF